MQLKSVRKCGPEIETIFYELAELRIKVFKDFPYLYQGTLEYEKQYLLRYIRNPKALVLGLYDNNELVGATSALPLEDEDVEFKKPFVDSGLDVKEFFYFGESLLLKQYRGHGYGHLFFNERETYAKSFDQYKYSTFCSVDRPIDHPMKPKSYRPHDFFWQKRGYEKQQQLFSHLSWQDVDELQTTEKKLTFWMKKL